MKENYKLQNTNYKKNGPRITRINTNFQKERDKYNDCFNQKFLRGGAGGAGGAVFSKSAPLAGGKD
jgi:hypothetical protein